MIRLTPQKERHQLLCEFLRLFYQKGWVTGTGGGICVLDGDSGFLVAPTGVHKERVEISDLFSVDPTTGNILRFPQNKDLKISECLPIFCALINHCGAGSVMHSHALSAVLAADLKGSQRHVTFQNLEMLKGIQGVSNMDRHCVPVIHNTVRESELLQQIHAILNSGAYRSSFAILVKDHGAYIWGKDIWEAKRHAEAYHFLFEATVVRRQQGIK